MYQVIIVVHVLLSLGIIGLVLMQQGKGADAGAAFGSGASGTVFGAQGATSFLSRTTAIFATLFFATSLGLASMGGYHGNEQTDLMDTTEVEGVKTDTKNIPVVKEDMPQVVSEDHSKTANDTAEKVKAGVKKNTTTVTKKINKEATK